MMKNLRAQQATMTSSLDKLAKTVGNGRTVRINTEQLSKYVAGRFEESVATAVKPQFDSLHAELDEYQAQMGTLGTEKLKETQQAIDTTLNDLQRAEQRIAALERRATFVGVGRLALAVLPVFAALIIVGSLVWGVGEIVGVGPVFSWVWDSFTAASIWWHKALIALGGLAGAGVFLWLVLRGAQWIYEQLR